MKLRNSLITKIVATAISLAAIAGLNKQSEGEGLTLSPTIEYEYWILGDEFKYEHKTHPADQVFLDGGPGETSIKSAHALKVGMDVSKKLGKNGLFEPYIGGAGMYVFGEDRQDNDNDPRPSGKNSRVYSKLFPLAPQFEAGLKLNPFKKFSVAASSSTTYLIVEHGWDRFGKDQEASNESKIFFNVGGKLEYLCDDFWKIGGGYSKGINSESSYFSFGASYNF